MKALRLALLLLLVAACAPKLQPFDLVATEPQLTPFNFISDDGAVLPLRTWLPEDPPRAVVLALHGFNDYSKAFENPGAAWRDAGIATFAYDQRGFGAAPYRGRWAGGERMARDAGLALQLLNARYPDTPVFLLGESMGGAIALTLATGDEPPPVAGLILVAPAVRGRAALGPLASNTLWFFGHTLPWYKLTGEGLNIRPSDNLEALRELFEDPMVIKATRIDAIYGLVDLMDAAAVAAPKLRTATLVLYGANEEVVSVEAAREFIESLPKPPAPVRVAVYAQGYHLLFRDRDAGTVIGDVAAWTAAPGEPLPSGADGSGVAAFVAR
ncbi:MAG TPA: alpha/beta hydrolase [Alphaproteobacteria bacterium]